MIIRKENDKTIEKLRREKKNYVVVFWHGSMLVGWFLQKPGKEYSISALVSQSKDGQFLSDILERWGFTLIRGSSHIGGKEAMQLMSDAVGSGKSLCITPDGPRGPRHEMKMGAIRVAQKNNVPLILMGIGLHRKKYLKNWDRFEIPIPFSSVTVTYSEPIIVPADYSGMMLDEFKMNLQNKLIELQGQSERSA